ncbi:hypothetical protein K502DRAFT_353072 [Neoconidiobolus thromboides FSU 785]|nr:hypothetical protein K502DRAFT_353072 [Neoconidiobolus thromboides FSU 785]
MNRIRPLLYPTKRYLTTKKLITTPIYYVNSKPHIGHLYTNVISDVYSRYFELTGDKVLQSTGCDEHGLKIYQASTKQSITPQLFCDKIAYNFLKLKEKSEMKEDTIFIRTSEERHKKIIREVWLELERKGYIYKDFYEGWYAISDEAFVKEEEVEKKGDKYYVKSSQSEVVWMNEPTYKFKLSMFKEQIQQFILENENAILPLTRRNEVLSLIEDGINDLSISRPTERVKWGIQVPNDNTQTIYVWLDALFNYLTVTEYPDVNYRQYFDNRIHIVGKDILKFHTIYWYGFCLALGLSLPKVVLAHGHWTNLGMKMSKSKGNSVDPIPLIEQFGSDPIRYFLLRNGGDFNMDSDFNENTLKVKYKKELVSLLGNLILRITSPSINPEQNIQIITDTKEFNMEEHQLILQFNNIISQSNQYMLQYQPNKSIELIINGLILANQYIQKKEPWKLNNITDFDKKQKILYLLFEIIKITTILLLPIMPIKCNQILTILNIDESKRNLSNIEFMKGWNITNNNKIHLINKEKLIEYSPLFPKLN